MSKSYKFKQFADRINKEIASKNMGDYTNLISDGSHTFGELYYQRMKLTAVIAKAIRASSSSYEDFASKVTRSYKHSDGTMFDGYFIITFNTPDGYFSYHYHIDHLLNFISVPCVDFAPEWDGHTDVDVDRLLSLFSTTGEIIKDDE